MGQPGPGKNTGREQQEATLDSQAKVSFGGVHARILGRGFLMLDGLWCLVLSPFALANLMLPTSLRKL
jgi:hypothetical protein